MEKYFIYLDNCTLGVKYASVSQLLTVGGYLRFRREIITLCEEYFGVAIDAETPFFLPQANKCKYVILTPYRSFYNGLKLLTEHEFSFVKTTSLERLFR